MGTMLSWGRYPYAPQTPHTVAWRDTALAAWQAVARDQGSSLAFGNGRSYGDSCLAASGHVVRTRSLDRLIAADWQTGVLRAESGITLDEILDVAIPRGWMLPVTPGTKYVTLGGAIANDVHGKNHHVRGTFGNHVRRFALTRSDGSLVECAPDTQPELFAATIGGLGLTGLVMWVEIQLMPIRSSLIDVTSIRFPNLDGFFKLSEQLDPKHEYSVAWVDCLSRGASLGRGIFMVGDHAAEGALEVNRRKKHTVPFTLPVPLFNGVTLRALNELYYRRQRRPEVHAKIDYDAYFYPLDSLLEWNRIYGRAGFQQYQCVVPPYTARDATRAILEAISSSGTGSFLAVLKRCGKSISPGLLSFPMEGTSLALDFPQRDASIARLFTRLDAIVREAGGRLYPAKDAHMSGPDFRAAYPQWQQLEALRDPAMLSRFWERTTRS
ncbi:FAD-binding oxidoreductase [Burkholderia pseudomallei]|uniref:FAD-binding oxidoreductase n=1 Tax=Burkholderia TaxID=32008 RepID=UPI0004F5DBC5|nr:MULTISPECIES: FAD-binding oxidoreductase [Burkholderia]AIO94928.1 FAD binding domain protein [Burkholderia pseudomallei 576]ANW49997.1 FAD-linked oxidase [Burkholderia pseudomallei]ANW56009.1 FAD-linked oxidase [Burkholderia pseudomallei]KGD26408.1 FAD binding domain protein [Burkholderia pseudomallei]MCS6598871.1 FAD-binding oxidoreductase [Burkholderia pseudomallei]